MILCFNQYQAFLRDHTMSQSR